MSSTETDPSSSEYPEGVEIELVQLGQQTEKKPKDKKKKTKGQVAVNNAWSYFFSQLLRQTWRTNK